MRFQDNLKKYEEANSFSRSDILELAEVTEEDIWQFETNCHVPAMYRFCVNLEIDFSSIYDEEGFKNSKLEDQYDKIPDKYKAILTKLIVNKLTEYADTYTLRKQLTAVTNSLTRARRFFSGSSALTGSELEQIKDKLNPTIREEFKYIFASTMWSRIPNINLSTAKYVYKLILPNIGNYLEVNKSTPGNWVGNMKVALPNKYINALEQVLGNFSYEKFSTCIISEAQFKHAECTMPIHVSLPDLVSDDQPVEHGEIHKEEVKEVSNINTDDDKDISKETPSNPLGLCFTDERIVKMYNALTASNKSKVYELIVDLFFAQLN